MSCTFLFLLAAGHDEHVSGEGEAKTKQVLFGIDVMVNETTLIVTVRSMTLIFLYFLHSNAKPIRNNDFGKFY